MSEDTLLSSSETSKEIGATAKSLRKMVRRRTPDVVKLMETSLIVKDESGWRFSRQCFDALKQLMIYAPGRRREGASQQNDNKVFIVKKDSDVYPVPPQLTDGNPYWFGLRISAGREQMVFNLIQRYKERVMYDLDKLEVYMPIWHVVEDGKQVGREAVFHKILFIKTAYISEVYYKIRQVSMHVRGWWTAVKGSGVPCMIPNDYMESISKEYEFRIKENEVKQKLRTLTVGMYVRVTEGPFRGFNGQVTGVGSLVKVELPIFGRLTEVSLGATQIDRLEDSVLVEAGVKA
jgi:transcription antitermination factor NusG